MRLNRLFSIVVVGLTTVSVCFAQGGSRGAKNPFSAPEAKIQRAPERMYDLEHLRLDLNVDYPDRLLTATATNTIVALNNGTRELRFHAGSHTKIDSVQLDGHDATFKRDDEGILVDSAPTVIGQRHVVTVHYHLKKSEDGGRGGWYWIEPRKNDPARTGFWTNGETSDTRDWAVTWDYPNDFATSETHTTVPAEWEVISNGVRVSDNVNPDGKTRTVVWRMSQPHATYLTSAVGGLYDIHVDNWRGVPLYYVAPKTFGNKLDYSVAHTKDMLSFYSDKLGVKYPWPKYAEDFTYDFGGGQENVSATTFGIFLTDPRDGYYQSDWLLAHEMGHQWFGDLVTCKDWGQIWLNESFATFMEMSYTRYSRGLYSSQREFEQNSQGYFDESRRYQRPIATNFYASPGVMFDQHTYPKGGALLFALRKQIGENTFYKGLNHYLTVYRYTPVETADLERAMTQATGMNMSPWFDQWILKPGHPVIDWSWSYDGNQAVVHVLQVQDRSHGAPVYDVPTKIALLYNSGTKHVVRVPVRLNQADQTFTLASAQKPDAVVFDADQDFLREIKKQPWKQDELVAVIRYAPNCVDKQEAMNRLLSSSPSDADVKAVVEFLRADHGLFPAILDDTKLAAMKKPELRAFFEGELQHESLDRRAHAAEALAGLPATTADDELLREHVNDHEYYRVVAATIKALAKLDFPGSESLIREQATRSNKREVRGAALEALAEHDASGAGDLIFASLDENMPDDVQAAGLEALAVYKREDNRTVPALRQMLQTNNFQSLFTVAQIAGDRKMKELIPDLEALKRRNPRMGPFVDQTLQKISS